MKITFHLKSGAAITVVAESISINKQNGNDIVGYEIVGMKRADDLFYIRLDDVSAITTKD